MIGNLLGVLKQMSSSASTQLFNEVFEEFFDPPHLDKFERVRGAIDFLATPLALPGFFWSTSYAPGPRVKKIYFKTNLCIDKVISDFEKKVSNSKTAFF